MSIQPLLERQLRAQQASPAMLRVLWKTATSPDNPELRARLALAEQLPEDLIKLALADRCADVRTAVLSRADLPTPTLVAALNRERSGLVIADVFDNHPSLPQECYDTLLAAWQKKPSARLAPTVLTCARFDTDTHLAALRVLDQISKSDVQPYVVGGAVSRLGQDPVLARRLAAELTLPAYLAAVPTEDFSDPELLAHLRRYAERLECDSRNQRSSRRGGLSSRFSEFTSTVSRAVAGRSPKLREQLRAQITITAGYHRREWEAALFPERLAAEIAAEKEAEERTRELAATGTSVELDGLIERISSTRNTWEAARLLDNPAATLEHARALAHLAPSQARARFGDDVEVCVSAHLANLDLARSEGFPGPLPPAQIQILLIERLVSGYDRYVLDFAAKGLEPEAFASLPWQLLNARQTSYGGTIPEQVRELLAPLESNPQAWELLAQMAPDYSGSIGELIATVRATFA